MNNWICFNEALASSATVGATADATSSDGAEAESVLLQHFPAHAYHADRTALSCSLLKPLLISPAHFQAALLSPDKDSPARDFGSLVHLLLLEPSLVCNEVAVYPGIADGRDSDCKEFEARNSHKLIVDEPVLARALVLAGKVADKRYKGRPFARFIEESEPEASIYFTEPSTQVRLRIRLDVFHPDITFDLKTTRHPSAGAFARAAVDLDYDLQAYMYSLGRRFYEGTATKPFVFIAAESNEPHSIAAYEAGDTFLENGATKFRICLTGFKGCSQTDCWPDLGGHTTLEITPWQQCPEQPEWRQALGT